MARRNFHGGSRACQPGRRFLDPLSRKPPAPVAHTGYILNLEHANAPAPLQFADSAGYGGGGAMSASTTANAGASTNGNGHAHVQTSGNAGGSVAGFGMRTH